MLFQSLFCALHDLVIQIEVIHSVQNDHEIARWQNILPQDLAYTRFNVADIIENRFSRALIVAREQFAQRHGKWDLPVP